MTLEEKIAELKTQYDIISVIDLDHWHELDEIETKNWFRLVLGDVHKNEYQNHERIIFTLSRGDIYSTNDSEVGRITHQLQKRLNEVDISNFFVILLTTDITVPLAYSKTHHRISSDPVPFSVMVYEEKIIQKQIAPVRAYNYNDRAPLKIDLKNLDTTSQDLLTKNPTFCIYPWIHFHAYPTGDAYPCCMADMQFPIGNLRKNTMREIWNQEPMREMRRNMIAGKPVEACSRCYEQENAGFMSGRISANKHHGHHINLIKETDKNGQLDRFELTYWDIRFSNLCNLSCRSCGHIFSSSWYQDQAKLAGPEWKKTHRALNYAGRFETDAWEQLVEHIDYVEQIYFAGGEPLMMDEHYRILEELERRERFDVRLIYNTNFTHVKLKDRVVFDYWKKFQSVSVGASLDAMGARAEYIRKGTDWAEVEDNRRRMMETCPNVDFYISPTLSIMNAWHLPDFHRDWVEKGLIRPQDLNVNILQDPVYYRIDIAPIKYKQRLRVKFEEHLEWLKPQDKLNRASVGFESAINFMMATDNTRLLEKFWAKTHQLDSIRNEKILDIIPELEALNENTA